MSKQNPFTCTACGHKFGGVSGFDAHRIGKFKDEHSHYGRKCCGPIRMEKMGYVLKDGVWIKPMSDAMLKRWA